MADMDLRPDEKESGHDTTTFSLPSAVLDKPVDIAFEKECFGVGATTDTLLFQNESGINFQPAIDMSKQIINVDFEPGSGENPREWNKAVKW